MKTAQLRNKDLSLTGQKNGGQWALTRNTEVDLTLKGLGINNEEDLVVAVREHCLSKVKRMMANPNMVAKARGIEAEDILNESAISLINAYRAGKMDNVTNVIGYIRRSVHNAVSAKTALSNTPVDHRAFKELNEILEGWKKVFGEYPEKELRESFIRQLRESWNEDGGSHKPSLGYWKPPVYTVSVESLAPHKEDVTSSDELTANLLSRGDLFTPGSIAESAQPEIQAINRLGDFSFAAEEELNYAQEIEELADIAASEINESGRQMSGVLRRRYFDILARKYKLPSTNKVQISQGRITKLRDIVATPKDLQDACRAWTHAEWDDEGNLPPMTEAFFAPWGETDEEEKDRIVDFFTKGIKAPDDALKMWRNVLASVNTSQQKRDRKYEALAAAEANGGK